VGGAILLFLAGTNIQSGWLFVLSSLLVGAALGGAVVPWLMVRRVAVERRGPEEAFVGEDVVVDLAVTTGGGGKLFVTVRDPHVAPTTVFVPHVRGGETVVARTERTATRRGVTEAATVEVASAAPFGVAEARRRVACPGRMVVLPRIVQLGSVPFLEAGLAAGDEVSAGTRRGEGSEYAGVREYRRGDSMRRVHWPATARHGSLVVREVERERPGALAIVVDTSADAGDRADDTVLDLCCSVAGSVAVAALSGGHEVQLTGGRGGTVPPLARLGRAEALRWLAEVEPTGGPAMPATLEAVGSPASGPDAYLLVVPTWKANADLAPAVGSLAASGRRVMVALIDTERLGPGAAGLAGAQVDSLERALRSVGATVRRIRTPEDVASLGRGDESR